MICKTCDKWLKEYPCPHCGEEGGEVFIGKEGTGRP